MYRDSQKFSGHPYIGRIVQSDVAKHLLAVPAASTSPERLFSMAGLTLSDRRANLSGDSVDGLLFIHGMG